MPTTIKVGSWVTAKAGPLHCEVKHVNQTSDDSSSQKKRKRLVRKVVRGWVVGPGRSRASTNSNTTWRVLWMHCGKCCDFSGKQLKLVANPPSDAPPCDTFKKLRDEDYFTHTTEYYKYIDNGNYNSELELDKFPRGDDRMPDGKFLI